MYSRRTNPCRHNALQLGKNYYLYNIKKQYPCRFMT